MLFIDICSKCCLGFLICLLIFVILAIIDEHPMLISIMIISYIIGLLASKIVGWS